jgi:membrane glycosyltransferase
VRACAECCGLPALRGRKPFGGAIQSHDFVEAAFMRRAGWSVRMLSNLEGSWEEGPPSLLDAAARDRRWAQGNLQHLAVLPARGLTWPSRVHLLIGVMSYLASPLWLLLIMVGLALTLQAAIIRPEYFVSDFQLFPTWPRFDAERMIRLFIGTMGVLLLPGPRIAARVLRTQPAPAGRLHPSDPGRHRGARAVGALCARDDGDPVPAALGDPARTRFRLGRSAAAKGGRRGLSSCIGTGCRP